jgi:hypothetical protein
VDGSATSDLDAGYRADRPEAGNDAGQTDTAAAETEAAVSPLRDATGSIPQIADYWPDAPPHRRPTVPGFAHLEQQPVVPETAGAPPPAYPQDPTPTRVFSPPPPPRRPWLRVLLAALAAALFLGGSVVALTRLVTERKAAPAVPAEPATQPDAVAQGQDNPPVSLEPAPSSTAPADAAASASPTALPFTSGVFEMSGAVTELHLTVGDLGTVPFEASTPAGSGLKPRSSIADDTVKLTAQSDGTKGSGKLDVRLNDKVAWGLRILSGIKNASYGLTGVSLRGIDLRGGAARIEMTLPRQDDTIPIRMSGGVNTWVIATAEEAPVKVRLHEGGGAVNLNGQRVNGVKKGSTLVDPVDDADTGGLDIDAIAGLGSLTVTAGNDA